MAEPIVEVITPLNQTTPPVAEAPKVEAKETAKPTPSRGNRSAQIRDIVAAMPADSGPADDDEKPATPVEAAPAAKPEEKPAELSPEEVQSGKAKAWADVMAREAKVREESRRVKAEAAAHAARLKEADDRDKLLRDDPVAYAAKYGGADFNKKLIQRTLNDGKAPPDEEIKTLKQELAALKNDLQTKEQTARQQEWINGYVSEHQKHWAADKEAGVLAAWFDPAEAPKKIYAIANEHYVATQEQLTPAQLSDSVLRELKTRLERVSKTEAGQQLLKQFVKADPTSAAGQPKPKAPATAPKTLSQDLNAAGAPADERRLRSQKDRQAILREAIRQMPQE